MGQDFDLFFLFRRLLVIFGTTYSLVKLGSLLGRAIRLARSREAKTVLLRQYVYAHLAEMRLGRFLPQALQIAGLMVVLGGVLYLHWL